MWVTENKKPLRRILVHGTPAIGKSSLFAAVDGSYFMNLEDGLGDIPGLEGRVGPLCHAYYDVVQQLDWLCEHIPDDMTTLVIDTVDWLEQFIHKQIAVDANVQALQDIGFGKGYGRVPRYWALIKERLQYIYDRGIMLVFICHSRIEKFSPPGIDSYDQYVPALHHSFGEPLQEWCTEVLFANYEVLTRTEDLGFNKERHIAMDSEMPRMLWTVETPAVKAKNRLGMPAKIPLCWKDDQGGDCLSRYIPRPVRGTAVDSAGDAAGNIIGKVVEGSSKIADAVPV
jgi:hypothetical protein